MFIPAAITNGLVREKLYKPMVGDLLAHQISTAIASVVFLVLAYSMLKDKLQGLSFLRPSYIGSVCIFMTALFELGFGRLVDIVAWEKLLADYNILQGRIWTLFLLLVFLSPFMRKSLTRR